MLSVVCSTRLRITPMRSSNDCCMRAICSCKACTWVCNWIMSLFAAKAGSEMQQTATTTKVNRNSFFIGFPLDAELLLEVEIGARGVNKSAAGTQPAAPAAFDHLFKTKCARRFCCQHASLDS